MDPGRWPQPVHVATTMTLTETAGGSGQSLPADRKDAEKKSKRAESQGNGGRERRAFILSSQVRMFTPLRLVRLLFVFFCVDGQPRFGYACPSKPRTLLSGLAFRAHMLSHRDWCVSSTFVWCALAKKTQAKRLVPQQQEDARVRLSYKKGEFERGAP
nr:MAG: MC052R [Molluscum contagiosum virus]